MLAGAITGLGIALRIPLLPGSFWRDEGSTYGVVAATSLRDVLQGVHRTELTPPLYYLLEHFWTRLAGFGEFAMRLPSLGFALGSIVLLYALVLLAGSRTAAVCAALIAALHPVYMSAGTEARAYGLAVFLCVAALYAFARLLYANGSTARGIWATVFALCGGALEATHFTGFIITGVLLLASGVHMFLRHSAAARTTLLASIAALLLGIPVLFGYGNDIGRFSGSLSAERHQPVRLLIEHLTPLFSLGPMGFQADVLLLCGFVLWIWSVAQKRSLDRSDRWIALAAGIVVAGICISILERLPIERHLLPYAPAAWMLTALLAQRFVQWLRTSAALPARIAQGMLVLLLAYVCAGVLWKYPSTYAVLASPLSGARDLVHSLERWQHGRKLLLVALPDSVAPSLWYYLRNDPAIALHGVATWQQPQYYSFDSRPWFKARFEAVEAARVSAFSAQSGDEIALAIENHPSYFNGIPFYRALCVAPILERRYGVAYRRHFYGWREPMELVMLRAARRTRPRIPRE